MKQLIIIYVSGLRRYDFTSKGRVTSTDMQACMAEYLMTELLIIDLYSCHQVFHNMAACMYFILAM